MNRFRRSLFFAPLQYLGHVESGAGTVLDASAYNAVVTAFTELLQDPVFHGFDEAGNVQSAAQEVCPPYILLYQHFCFV